ncbi:MAG: hypothetical protein ABIA78_00755 [archaeon]
MKKRLSIWDILAWVALVSIVVWGVLKVAGVINTPLLLEYYPLFAVSYVFGWQMNKLNDVAREVEGLKNFRNETIKHIHLIKENCARNHQ